MPPVSNEGQFKFLISCIRYSNNGKVDFNEVARECGIVSKGAAAKRYERMMKAHGIHQSATSVRDTPTPSRRRKDGSTCAANKKRKVDDFMDENSNAADDDEVLGNVKDEGGNVAIKIADDGNELCSVKPESKNPIKEECGFIKEENLVDDDDMVGNGYFQTPFNSGNQGLGIDDDGLFGNYLLPGALDHQVEDLQQAFDGSIAQGYPTASKATPVCTDESPDDKSILIAD